MHAKVRVGDTVVMIADAGGTYPAFPAWLHVYVPDVDETYSRALPAGGLRCKNRSAKCVTRISAAA